MATYRRSLFSKVSYSTQCVYKIIKILSPVDPGVIFTRHRFVEIYSKVLYIRKNTVHCTSKHIDSSCLTGHWKIHPACSRVQGREGRSVDKCRTWCTCRVHGRKSWREWTQMYTDPISPWSPWRTTVVQYRIYLKSCANKDSKCHPAHGTP